MNVQYSPWTVHRMNHLNLNMNIMEPLAELDGGFEPQTRARSNTWPLPRPENYVEPGEEGSNKCATAGMDVSGGGGPVAQTAVTSAKKNSSRRNAWGNLSYADLITQAITSAADKRLTLSQIYEWMVQNVPYFKDKGDSNSSAGWKNSIRHNLSLHNRFMRVQNEGTGKSSWWMINPDAKPGKSVRRRAASMETSKFEKRRGRVKKKVEALRNGITADITPSPSSSISEGLDTFPSGSPLQHSNTGFQLSPDFRPRTSSNTSSCGGRLSPIPSMLGVEHEWNTTSPFQNSSYSPADVGGQAHPGGSYSPESLAVNLDQSMKLQPDAYLGYMNGHTPQQPPPPYSAPYEPFMDRRDISSLQATSPYGLPQCPIHRLQPCGCMQVQCKVESMSPSGMSPSYPTEPSPDPLSSQYMYNTRTVHRPMSGNSPPTAHSGQQQQPPPQPHQAQTMMGQLMGTLNSPLLDEFNIDSLDAGLACNVEEVLKHELKMEGSLGFDTFHNFPAGHEQMMPGNVGTDLHTTVSHHNQSSVQEPPVYATTATTPSWVH